MIEIGETNSASAKIIADSVTHEGHRLITVEAKCWRPVLAEQNTHCVLSRNSASSRAIPVRKMIERFAAECMDNPIVWPHEQKGMQGGGPLVGQALYDAQDLWNGLTDHIHDELLAYVDNHPEAEDRLHKSLLNRWLEIGLWQTQIISATQWDGYFWQRCHKDAEPHIRAMAEAIQAAVEESTPKLLEEGEWHLPYWADQGGHESDWADAGAFHIQQHVDIDDYNDAVLDVAKRCSAARTGRVSYLTHDGVRDLEEDLNLYARLTSNRVGSEDPPHASPLEHVATPWADNVQDVTMLNGVTMRDLPKLGKFVGWAQLRHLVLGF